MRRVVAGTTIIVVASLSVSSASSEMGSTAPPRAERLPHTPKVAGGPPRHLSPAAPSAPSAEPAALPSSGTEAVVSAPAAPTALTSSGIPQAVLAAYVGAAAQLAARDPECALTWPLLAAIGRVESDHARLGGARLTSDGVAVPPIRGPRLDGAGPVALIPDTDGGRLDGDTTYDRAVGPMQFLPSTWRGLGQTGDPQNINEAALAAGIYLCAGAGSLGDPAWARRALWRYNPSQAYVDRVLALAAAYASDTNVVPAPETDDPPAAPLHGSSTPVAEAPSTQATSPTPTQPAEQEPAPSSTPAPETSATPAVSASAEPTPMPTPTASAEPTPMPTPTASAEPTPTPTATASPEATPTPTATSPAEPTTTASPTP